MNNIRAFLVDDHQVFLDGLSLLLRSAGIETAGTANNGVQACEHLRRTRADILIMDIDMPVMDGITATGILRRDYPGLRILLMSMHTSPAIIRRAIHAGANGYMLKHSGGAELTAAISAVLRGETHLCPNAAAAVVEALPVACPPTGMNPLTQRELEVVRYVVREYSNAGISEQLHIDIRTVEAHRRNIMRKLDINNSVALVKYAISRGWV